MWKSPTGSKESFTERKIPWGDPNQAHSACDGHHPVTDSAKHSCLPPLGVAGGETAEHKLFSLFPVIFTGLSQVHTASKGSARTLKRTSSPFQMLCVWCSPSCHLEFNLVSGIPYALPEMVPSILSFRHFHSSRNKFRGSNNVVLLLTLTMFINAKSLKIIY